MAKLEWQQLRRMTESAIDETADARALSERDRDYFDNYQWTQEQRSVLEKRKQPVLTVNKIQNKINSMIGIEQRGRVDPRALPRTPNDEEAADVATKALVYVDDVTDFDMKRSDCFANMLIEGHAAVEIGAEPGRSGLDVTVNRIRWEEFVYDPHSRERDFSDANYMGVLRWMSMDAALEVYGDTPETREVLEASVHQSSATETYDDRPFSRTVKWVDKRAQRVRVCQLYYRRAGAWYMAIFTAGGELFNDFSPYVDEDGGPDCPIVAMSAYVDRENRRYGVVRSMISMQDEVNQRRSKLLHMLNSRQVLFEQGAVDDLVALDRELAAPDGKVKINEGFRFEIMTNTDQISGQAELLAEAKAELDLQGPNASLQGAVNGDQSGRAILAQQNAGLIELSPIYDALRQFTTDCYRKMWERIRQFWDGPRYVRVTDEMEAPQFLAVNVPVMDQFGQIVGVENRLAEMDMDIVIDQAPDVATLQQEQFEQLTLLAQSGYQIPLQVLIRASALRDKQQILEDITGSPEQQQAQAAKQAQIAEASAAADIDAKQAKAARDRAAAVKDVASAAEMQVGPPVVGPGSAAIN